MDISKEIKRLRVGKRLTLQSVADIVGVNKSTIKRWEDGDIANMGIDKLSLIAGALGVTPAYLMGWEDSKGIGIDQTYEKTDGPTNLGRIAARLTSENQQLLSDFAAMLLQKQ